MQKRMRRIGARCASGRSLCTAVAAAAVPTHSAAAAARKSHEPALTTSSPPAQCTVQRSWYRHPGRPARSWAASARLPSAAGGRAACLPCRTARLRRSIRCRHGVVQRRLQRIQQQPLRLLHTSLPGCQGPGPRPKQAAAASGSLRPRRPAQRPVPHRERHLQQRAAIHAAVSMHEDHFQRRSHLEKQVGGHERCKNEGAPRAKGVARRRGGLAGAVEGRSSAV